MKRRDFAAIGGITAAGLTFGFSAPNILTTKTTESINLGIIGTGSRGSGLMQTMKKIEGINITACCDLLPFRLKKALAITENKAKGFEDYRELLDDANLDAVLIAVPFGLHAQVAIDAIDAGKHIYCEKTMCRGYDDIKRLVKKVKSTDKIFQVGYQYHSSKMYVDVAKKIKEGMIGEITAFQSQWNRNGDWRRPVPDPKWEKLINWRMYKEYSGGLIAELSSHQIEFANWVLGENPIRIMGTGGIDHWKDGRETYDNIQMIHEYASGVKATYSCTTTNGLSDYKIKVLGSKGTIVLDYAKAWFFPEEIVEKEMGNLDGVSGATIYFEQEKGYEFGIEHIDPSLQALINFKNSVLEDIKPLSDVFVGGHAATAVQMSIDAVHKKEVELWKDDYNLF